MILHTTTINIVASYNKELYIKTVHSYGRAGRRAKVAPPSGQKDKALSCRTETRGEVEIIHARSLLNVYAMLC